MRKNKTYSDEVYLDDKYICNIETSDSDSILARRVRAAIRAMKYLDEGYSVVSGFIVVCGTTRAIYVVSKDKNGKIHATAKR